MFTCKMLSYSMAEHLVDASEDGIQQGLHMKNGQICRNITIDLICIDRGFFQPRCKTQLDPIAWIQLSTSLRYGSRLQVGTKCAYSIFF